MRNYYTLTENFLHSSKISRILIVQGMDKNKNAWASQKTSFIFQTQRVRIRILRTVCLTKKYPRLIFKG